MTQKGRSLRRSFQVIGFVLGFAVTFAAAPSLQAVTRVYISVPPPAPIVEVRGVAPGPHHVWVAGYHRWDGNAYVWAPGSWQVPPHHHSVWVAGHYSHHHTHGYYWVPGHWKH